MSRNSSGRQPRRWLRSPDAVTHVTRRWTRVREDFPILGAANLLSCHSGEGFSPTKHRRFACGGNRFPLRDELQIPPLRRANAARFWPAEQFSGQISPHPEIFRHLQRRPADTADHRRAVSAGEGISYFSRTGWTVEDGLNFTVYRSSGHLSHNFPRL
jgi:hypothetical protein